MFNNTEIKKVLEYLELNPRNSVVIMGTSIAMHGIRETNDIDCWTTPQKLNDIAHRFDVEPYFQEGYGNFPPTRKIDLQFPGGEVEIFGVLPENMKSVKTYVIDDVRVQDIEDVKELKASMGRPKDLKDIEAINEYIDFCRSFNLVSDL